MTDCRRLRYTVLCWQKKPSTRPCGDYAEKHGIKIEGLTKPKSDIHEGEEEEEEEY